MKPRSLHLQITLVILAFLLGRWERTPQDLRSVNPGSTPRPLHLFRTHTSLSPPRQGDTFAALLKLQQRLPLASSSALKRWEKALDHWPTPQRTLAMALIQSQWERIDPNQRRNADSSPAIASFLLSKAYGSEASTPPMLLPWQDQLLGSGDPAAILAKIPNGVRVIRRLAESDPAYAAELCLRLPPSERRNGGYHVLQTWLADDPQAATQWVESLKQGRLRSGLGQILVDHAAKTDPRAALEQMDLFQSIGHTSGASLERSIVHTWARDDPLAALAWVQDHPHPKPLIGNLLQPLVHAGHANVAVSLLESQPSLSDSSTSHAIVAESWASHDPSAALDWVRSLDTPPLHQAGLLGIAQAVEDPTQQRALAEEAMAMGPTDDRSLSQRVESLVRSLEPAVLKESNLLTDLAQFTGEALSQGTVSHLAETDPTWLAEQIESSPDTFSSYAARELMESWAAHEPHAAAAWLERLTEHPERDDLQQALVNQWGFTDPDGAVAWAQASTTRTMALIGPLTYHGNYQQALTLAHNTPDTTMQFAIRREVLRVWNETDPTAAKEALIELQLSPMETARLQASINDRSH